MKICYILEVNNPHSRRWISHFAQMGHEVLVLSDSAMQEEIAGVRVINPQMNLLTTIVAFKIYPKPYGNDSFKWIPYRKEVARFKPDIVHAMEARAYGFALARCGNYPKILTPWGNDIFLDPFQSRIARFLVTSGLRAATRITTNYPGLARYLKNTFGITEEKSRGFSWGIDLNMFRPDKKSEAQILRRELMIPPDAPVVVSNRTLAEYWGGRDIINALPLIAAEVPEAHFIVMRGSGKSNYLNEMRQIIERQGLSGRTRFIEEKVSPERMALVLNLADVFISATHSDMLSISVLEGMACGAAPVVSDLDAYRERITDGENGLYIRIGDSRSIAEKTIFALKNPQWRKAASAKNRDIIRRNDNWEDCRRKMEEVYEETLRLKNHLSSVNR